MKNILKHSFLSTVLLVFLFAGCDVMQSTESEEISSENLDLAARVIGSTLSDNEDGVLSSLYDASSNALSDEAGAGRRQGRGEESDYEYVYNPETGEHTVSFVRNVERRDMVKTLVVNSVYIYTDAGGGFLEIDRRTEEGREMWDQIETIEYRSEREGESTSPLRSHEFSRSDDLFFEGVSSPVITLEGSHEANGSMNVENELTDCPGSRTYSISLDFDNVQLDKAIVENGGTIEEAMTGFINYNMTVDGEVFEGTIELEDGDAWVQFYKVPDFFRIALADGSVTGNARRGQHGGEGDGNHQGQHGGDGDGNQHGHGDDQNKGDQSGEGNRHNGGGNNAGN